ncbi:hypothetical protein RB600_001483 [Gaeumannomyces tritici]
MTKTYIVAPNFSVPPNSLRLGDILVDPLDPDLAPLNRKARTEIPADDLSPVGVLKSFSATREKLLSGRFGLWTTFLAGLGVPVGVDMGLLLERHSKDVIKAGELHTHEFVASDEYVTGVMQTAAVKIYVDAFEKNPVPLYMITGLKIAKGMSVNLNDDTKVDAKLGVTLPDVAADVKPVLQVIRNRVDGVAFSSKTDLILAFRVREVISTGGKVEHKLWLKGASMLDGDEKKTAPTGKDTLGDDFSPEEAKRMAEEDEFQVMVVMDEKRDEAAGDKEDVVVEGPQEDEIEWIIASATA